MNNLLKLLKELLFPISLFLRREKGLLAFLSGIIFPEFPISLFLRREKELRGVIHHPNGESFQLVSFSEEKKDGDVIVEFSIPEFPISLFLRREKGLCAG